jgi:hypothetical protein
MRAALLVPLSLAVVLCGAGCGGRAAAPNDDPGKFAVKVVNLILGNHYATVWGDLHSADQRVAPRAEYVGCETRTPILDRPLAIKVLAVSDESVGLGNGKFVDSKAVDVRLSFAGNLKLTHTVHVVADGGRWRWILPSWRFRDYKADRCSSDAGSAPPPQSS